MGRKYHKTLAIVCIATALFYAYISNELGTTLCLFLWIYNEISARLCEIEEKIDDLKEETIWTRTNKPN